MTDTLPRVYIFGNGKLGDDIFATMVDENYDVLGSCIVADLRDAICPLHDEHPEVFEDRFGAFGEGYYYEIVIVDGFSDLPDSVKAEYQRKLKIEEDSEEEDW